VVVDPEHRETGGELVTTDLLEPARRPAILLGRLPASPAVAVKQATTDPDVAAASAVPAIR
jgi:hypothetical protein